MSEATDGYGAVSQTSGSYRDSSPESTHVDGNGDLIAEYDDGDNGVYVHNNGITTADIDTQRGDAANTGGTGTYIGDLGGEINVNSIYANILNRSGSEAEGGFDGDPAVLLNWVNRVKKDGDWDLKNNKKTIFGVVWKFDHSESKGDDKTTFVFGEMKGNAADFGNHHAGYTGTKAGIPEIMQKIGAGVIEQLKLKNYHAFNSQNYFTGPHLFFKKPHYDRQQDYEYNVAGMKLAKEN